MNLKLRELIHEYEKGILVQKSLFSQTCIHRQDFTYINSVERIGVAVHRCVRISYIHMCIYNIIQMIIIFGEGECVQGRVNFE